MPLFEVAVTRKPTKKEIEDGTVDEFIILPPTPVVARDGQAAIITVLTRDGGIKGFDANKCDAIVRPFA